MQKMNIPTADQLAQSEIYNEVRRRYNGAPEQAWFDPYAAADMAKETSRYVRGREALARLALPSAA